MMINTQTRTIPLSSPDITDLEIDAVLDVLRGPNLSLGPKLPEFESRFAEYIGVRHAIAVNSGTSGLHLCIRSLGIGPGDAVLTTPFSFIASANCILFERATPIFIDIDPETANISCAGIEEHLETKCEFRNGILTDIKTGTRVKAILPVHIFGYPCDMTRIMQIAKKYDLHVIEDACEALGAEVDGQCVGSFGDVSVFAFYPNKQITTGEGGIILTDSDEIANNCRSLRNQGRNENSGWLAHQQLGFNYRMSDIQCALGIAQLSRLDTILEKRRLVAKKYDELLCDLFQTGNHSVRFIKSWFVYVIYVPKAYNLKTRDRLLHALQERGIGCSNYFPPIHLQPFYRANFGFAPGDFPITESLSQRSIALPFHNNMRSEDIAFVAETLRELLASKSL